MPDFSEKLNMRQVVRVWAVEQVLSKTDPLSTGHHDMKYVVDEAKKLEEYVNADMKPSFSPD